MEYWRVVFKRISGIFDFIINTTVSINLVLHYPGTQYSNTPIFHHSNWAEAPDLRRSN